LTEWIVALPDAESLAAAYDQFLPESLGNLTTEAGASSVSFNDAMHSCRQRTGDYRFIAEGQCGWGRVDAVTRDQDQTVDNPGYRYDAISIAGGAQFQVAEDMHLGFAGTLQRSEIDADLSDTRGRQVEAGLILKRRFSGLMLSGSLSAGYGSYETFRQANGATATSSQDIYLGGVHGRISYDFEPAKNMYIRPLFDVGVTQVNRDAFDESGAAAANLSVDKERDTITTLQPAVELGGEFETNINVLIRPFVRLGATYYAGGSNTREVTAGLLAAPAEVAPFTVSTETDDTYGDLVLGLEFFRTNGASVRLEYAGQLSDNTQAHAGGVKFQIPF
jgi:outer membrane autotransporter protein